MRRHAVHFSVYVSAVDVAPYPMGHILMFLSTCILMPQSDREIVAYFGSVFGCFVVHAVVATTVTVTVG